MSKTIVGIFDTYDRAEMSAMQIKERGLKTDDISIVQKHREVGKDGPTGAMWGNTETSGGRGVNDNISDGVMTGGVFGGLAGLVLGAGTIMIPGLGLIAAAGPITGLLSGAVTGSIVGGLVDLGIPESSGRRYESDISTGMVLLSMRTDEDKISQLASILRSNGATSVDTY